jgi:hypothetical protein
MSKRKIFNDAQRLILKIEKKLYLMILFFATIILTEIAKTAHLSMFLFHRQKYPLFLTDTLNQYLLNINHNYQGLRIVQNQRTNIAMYEELKLEKLTRYNSSSIWESNQYYYNFYMHLDSYSTDYYYSKFYMHLINELAKCPFADGFSGII